VISSPLQLYVLSRVELGRSPEVSSVQRFHVLPSALMWATTWCRISLNIFSQHLIKESMKGPDKIPFLKACTIIASSLVCNFTTRGSPWYCFTSKRSKDTGGGARLIMNCYLNNVENWSNEVMCPSRRLMNQSSVVPENVPMNNLQCMASVPSEIIIWLWKAVMWAFESSVPVKVIFGVMKLMGIMAFMIA